MHLTVRDPNNHKFKPELSIIKINQTLEQSMDTRIFNLENNFQIPPPPFAKGGRGGINQFSWFEGIISFMIQRLFDISGKTGLLRFFLGGGESLIGNKSKQLPKGKNVGEKE
jgi:hypothetical protein